MSTVNLAQTRADQEHSKPSQGGTLPIRSVVFVMGTAFLLRLAVITIGHTYRITPRRDHFQFGWEMGRLARSIAKGWGFSSPTDLDSGPSAWTGPVYPYILAGIFKVCGIYSKASAWVILAFNSLFASLTCGTLFQIARHLFGPTVAAATAWTWALFPYLIYWPVRVVWEVSFTTFLLSLALWLAIVLAERNSGSLPWVGFGLLWGLIALTNTAVLILFPCMLAWAVGQLPARSQRSTAVAASALTLVLAITPWTLRNYQVFGRLILIRDNLALELYEANNESSSGFWTRSEHPGNDPDSMQRFQKLGEIAFMDEKREELVHFVEQHPDKVLFYTGKRFYYFWAAPPQASMVGGFELRVARHTQFLLASIFAAAGLILLFIRRHPYRWLLAPFLLVYPVPYYLVNPFPRYKHPIEPVMLMLIVYLLSEANRIRLPAGFGFTRWRAL
ncbi:MAG: glycosyltransferase family 39 protein [Acidobacteria bacterium]|nr:glycosyltransferase family 39 protein [Acidobacteriota bacterium]